MKNLILAAVVSLIPAAAFACDGAKDLSAENDLQMMTVPEVAKLADAKQVKLIDANDQNYREKNGIIPGAVLLSSYTEYSVKELPSQKDAQLVFYCANNMCTASHMAARRAILNGYTKVAVLDAGLAGWKKAGQKTATLKPPNS
jgi:rhodanese-related sulfurtransferase